jgi:hypothetical protein
MSKPPPKLRDLDLDMRLSWLRRIRRSTWATSAERARARELFRRIDWNRHSLTATEAADFRLLLRRAASFEKPGARHE